MEKQDRVLYFIKEVVDVVCPAEYFPFPEAAFVCSGSRGNNPFVDLLLHKEEISAECIRGLRAASFQDRTCGYFKLKCAFSSLSDRFHN